MVGPALILLKVEINHWVSGIICFMGELSWKPVIKITKNFKDNEKAVFQATLEWNSAEEDPV